MMRLLLVKILTCYIECAIIFANIEIVVFIVLNGANIFRNLDLTIREYNMFNSVSLLDFPLNLAGQMDSSQVFQYIDFEPFELVEDDGFKSNEHWHIVQIPSSSPMKWHIGLVIDIVDSDNNLVTCLDVFVDVSSFYTFPINAAKSYLIQVAEEYEDMVILAADLEYNLRVNGLRDLPDSTVIVKTYWIRIIQRRWRRIYSERMRLLKLRGGLKAQRQFELSGKYGIPVGDGLRGMLMSKSNSKSANIKTD